MKRRPSRLAADLAALERTDPAVALAADDLDRVTRQITGLPGGPLPERPAWQTRNVEAVARARREKARREAEAERWIAGVRARKAGKR